MIKGRKLYKNRKNMIQKEEDDDTTGGRKRYKKRKKMIQKVEENNIKRGRK